MRQAGHAQPPVASGNEEPRGKRAPTRAIRHFRALPSQAHPILVGDLVHARDVAGRLKYAMASSDLPSSDVPQVDLDFDAALERGDLASAARLLERGADVNRVWATTEAIERDTYDETKTYLRRAALYGDVAAVRFLLEHGADPNIAGIFSRETALLGAARLGHAEVVDLLLAHGADVSAVDSRSDQSVIDSALAGVHAPVVRSLLAAGAPARFEHLNFSINGGAAAREVVRLLVEHGVDINSIDSWGRTPLMWAAEYAEVDTVRLMMDLGADVNRVSEPNMNGWQSYHTALELARKENRKEVVALLRAAGAKVDPRSESPLDRLKDLFGFR
jgi:ankyrin repeat protein